MSKHFLWLYLLLSPFNVLADELDEAAAELEKKGSSQFFSSTDAVTGQQQVLRLDVAPIKGNELGVALSSTTAANPDISKQVYALPYPNDVSQAEVTALADSLRAEAANNNLLVEIKPVPVDVAAVEQAYEAEVTNLEKNPNFSSNNSADAALGMAVKEELKAEKIEEISHLRAWSSTFRAHISKPFTPEAEVYFTRIIPYARGSYTAAGWLLFGKISKSTMTIIGLDVVLDILTTRYEDFHDRISDQWPKKILGERLSRAFMQERLAIARSAVFSWFVWNFSYRLIQEGLDSGMLEFMNSAMKSQHFTQDFFVKMLVIGSANSFFTALRRTGLNRQLNKGVINKTLKTYVNWFYSFLGQTLVCISMASETSPSGMKAMVTIASVLWGSQAIIWLRSHMIPSAKTENVSVRTTEEILNPATIADSTLKKTLDQRSVSTEEFAKLTMIDNTQRQSLAGKLFDKIRSGYKYLVEAVSSCRLLRQKT